VAQALLAEFLAAAGLDFGAADVLYAEAHRWNNAYPLNPRAGRAGMYVALPEARLVACGDWCAGPRAGDAYLSGLEAAQAVRSMLGV
jgi:predicted NAD/FAD-dependent oxidoreductase